MSPKTNRRSPSGTASPIVANRALRSVAVIFFALALGGAGCGKANTAPAAQAPSAAPAAPAAQAPSAAPAATAPKPAADAAAKDLATFGNAYGNVEAKVAYDITNTGTDGKTQKSQIAYYWKPSASKTRVDVTAAGNSSVMITDAQSVITCDVNQKTCYKLPSSSGSAMGNGAPGADVKGMEQNAASPAPTATVSESHVTILGRAAVCFDVTVAGQSQISSSTCYDEGTKVMLSMDASGKDGRIKMEATSFSASVPDSSFDPPFPITDMGSVVPPGGVPQGTQLPGGANVPSGQ